jgi:hypothetical protein
MHFLFNQFDVEIGKFIILATTAQALRAIRLAIMALRLWTNLKPCHNMIRFAPIIRRATNGEIEE